MKKLLILTALFITNSVIFAQDDVDKAAAIKAEIKTKSDSIAAIQGRVNALEGELKNLPGWRTGAFGTIGANLSGFNNWLSQGSPDVNSGNIGITANGFANLKREKFFWNNSANLNLGWVKFDDKNNDADSEDFNAATDVFNISSLYGRNIAKNLAASALLEYRTTILDNFNDPGYLDLGVGATWTPIQNLTVVVHPLNYNFVFAENDAAFESSLGAKILVDYTKKIGAINFKSNLSAFQSYKSTDLSNWTWINSFGYTLWKNIGVGFEFGLRNNKQESLNAAGEGATFDTIDNDLQSYWLFGLSYSF